jgi:type IV pilus assembly protein PilA
MRTTEKTLPGWTSRNPRARGFSLVELLVVLAVILIVAAIAIPNLLESRMRAYEASGVESLRVLVTAEHLYITTHGNGFSPTLNELRTSGAPSCDAAALVDSVLASGVKNSYSFTYTGVGALSVAAKGCASPGFGAFQLNGDPIAPGPLGRRHFYSDQSGVIHQSWTGPATAADPAIN